MLLFTGVHFLGILEGHEWDLENLWRRLQTDGRHCELIRISSELCGMRWFPDWTLAYRNHAVVGAHIQRLRSSSALLRSEWIEMIRTIMPPADNIQADRQGATVRMPTEVPKPEGAAA